MPGQPDGLSAAWTWLGASFVLAVVAANVAWFFRTPRSNPIGSTVTRLVGSPRAPGLYEAARLLYYIGLPFAALLLGRDAVTARLLGLQPLELTAAGPGEVGDVITQNWLDWARDAGWAAVAGAAVFVFLLVAWWTYRRALASADFREERGPAQASGWTQLREAAYHEAHWAFYRNAPLIALRSEVEGAYLGIWIGLGVVALEAALNPEWRWGLSLPEQAPQRLIRVALALLSALLFWRTQNLWLALLLHFAISWALSAIARATTPSAR